MIEATALLTVGTRWRLKPQMPGNLSYQEALWLYFSMYQVHSPQQWNLCTTQFQQLLLSQSPFLSWLGFQRPFCFPFAFVCTGLVPTVMHTSRSLLRQTRLAENSLCLHYYPTVMWIGQPDCLNEVYCPNFTSALSVSFLWPSRWERIIFFSPSLS